MQKSVLLTQGVVPCFAEKRKARLSCKMVCLLGIAMLLCGIQPLCAQESGTEEPLRAVTTATMLRIGQNRATETYFSNVPYRGLNLGLGYERLQLAGFGEGRFTKQQQASIDLSNTSNAGGTGTMLTAFIRYGYGMFYNFRPLPGLQLLAGADLSAELGALYNLRNSNNPVNAKLAINLGISGMAIYTLRIRNYPITFRYQISNPVLGTFFMPPFGASYYELFSLGNCHDIFHFASFHNQINLTNLLTVDIPVGSFHLRFGYQNITARYRANDLISRIGYNQFIFGFTRSFVPVTRKNAKRISPVIRNAFYE